MHVSRLRTYQKRVDEAIQAKKVDEATKAFHVLQPAVMQGVQRNILHVNKASRVLVRTWSRIKDLGSK